MARGALTLIAFAVLAASCAERDEQRERAKRSSAETELTLGEERVQIAPKGEAATVLRSGPEVPVRLPPGFTLYPGAKIVTNTVFQREDAGRILLVFETSESVDKVIHFYRMQAQLGGVPLPLDLGSREQASIGGTLPDGGKLSVSARRFGGTTRVELAAS